MLGLGCGVAPFFLNELPMSEVQNYDQKFIFASEEIQKQGGCG